LFNYLLCVFFYTVIFSAVLGPLSVSGAPELRAKFLFPKYAILVLFGVLAKFVLVADCSFLVDDNDFP